ncbi:MAG: hypothetical protein J3K34DRAFT_296550 [Monoraphidium minutum]|nr:MAG: hypothetical protein J3K34DRAFT_296550 [Monoraphidium minutum]
MPECNCPCGHPRNGPGDHGGARRVGTLGVRWRIRETERGGDRIGHVGLGTFRACSPTDPGAVGTRQPLRVRALRRAAPAGTALVRHPSPLGAECMRSAAPVQEVALGTHSAGCHAERRMGPARHVTVGDDPPAPQALAGARPSPTLQSTWLCGAPRTAVPLLNGCVGALAGRFWRLARVLEWGAGVGCWSGVKKKAPDHTSDHRWGNC